MKKNSVLFMVMLLVAFTMCGARSINELKQQGNKEEELRKEEAKALLEAVQKGDLGKVVQLYNESERKEQKNKELLKIIGRSLVCLASYYGDVEIVSALLDADFPINQKDSKGKTPLMWALVMGNHELVQLLLTRGAQVEFNDNYDLVIVCARRGRKGRALLLLVEHIMEQDTTVRWKPLPWCIKHNYKEAARMLLDDPMVKTDIDETDNKGNTALLWSVKDNRFDAMKMLLQKGAKVECMNREGKTPLSIAADRCDKELTYELANYAAKKDEKNKSGYGALGWAAHHGLIPIVRLILKREATVINIRDKAGNTPLMLAVWTEHANVVRMLLNKGAKVDIKSERGKTAMIFATEKGNAEIIGLLSQQSEAIAEKNEFGWTLLMTAARHGHIKTLESIIDSLGQHARTQELEREAKKKKDKEQGNVKKKPEDQENQGGDEQDDKSDDELEGVSIFSINQTDDHGSTALYWAARFGQLKAVEILLKAAADVNHKNEYGWSPIYWACKNRHAAVVRFLLEHGAQIDDQLNYGWIMPYARCTQSIKQLFLNKEGEQA